MRVFAPISRDQQTLVASSPSINELGPGGFVSVLADVLNLGAGDDNPVPSISADASPSFAPIAAPATNRKPRGLSKARRVQLNVYVSAERRRELKAFARKHRVTMSIAVDAALELLFARDQQ